jgi:AcrR family transcriptional regulator
MSSSTPRRSRLPRAEREQQILDAAHALFAEHGYEAVTMDEVATRVGVTKPLLYAYVGNKERLYLLNLERSAASLQAAVLAAVQAADGPEEAFRAGVGAFFHFVDSDRDAWRVLFAETLPGGGDIARHVADFRQGLTALVAQILIERLPAEHRERARGEVEALSHALLGAAEGLARWWLGHGTRPPMPAAAAADLLVCTVQPGLRERARGGKPPTPSGDPTP